MEKRFSDMQIIQALKENVQSRNLAIAWICNNTRFRKRIYHYIQDHGGSNEDAEEVFQDGVLNLVKSVLSDSYRAEASVEEYLFGICRYLWYRKFRQSQKHTSSEFSDKMVVSDENQPDILIIEKEKRKAVASLLQNLGEACNTVLTLWCSGYSYKEIARKMGYSDDYTRLRVYRCKRQLEELLDQHPELLKILKQN